METVDTAPEQAQSFSELEQQLRDMPVLYGESPDRQDPPQTEESVSPAESEPALDSSETEISPAETLEVFTVEAVAEALQMDQTEFYKQFQIPISDGETMSLSEIKDRMKDVVRSDVLLAEVQTNREKVETDLLQKNQALMIAQQQAGVQVTEQHLHQAAQQRKAYGELQDRTLTELLPEYAAAAFRQDFDSKVAKRLEAMGYTKQEAGFMKDARLRLEFYKHQRQIDEIAGIAHKRARVKRDQTPKVLTRNNNTVQSIASGSQTQNQKVEELGRMLKF